MKNDKEYTYNLTEKDAKQLDENVNKNEYNEDTQEVVDENSEED